MICLKYTIMLANQFPKLPTIIKYTDIEFDHFVCIAVAVVFFCSFNILGCIWTGKSTHMMATDRYEGVIIAWGID